MRALEGWSIDRYGGPELTKILDPDDRVAATVRPARRPWAPLWKVVRLERRLAEIQAEAWRASGGGIPVNLRGEVELADGTRVVLRNGTPTGPLRRAGNSRISVAGRRYVFAHTSGTTAEVRRDGTLLVHASTGGGRRRPDDARESAAGRGVDLAIRAELDRTDELVVVLFTEICGPPGRIGAVRRIASAIWDSAVNY